MYVNLFEMNYIDIRFKEIYSTIVVKKYFLPTSNFSQQHNLSEQLATMGCFRTRYNATS